MNVESRHEGNMVQFKVGYYLFAILFLMFDIETVFLFPWAVVVNEVGTYAWCVWHFSY